MDSGIAEIIATPGVTDMGNQLTSAIVPAVITSLVSLIVFIGSTIYSRMNTDKPYKTKIYEQQLFKVFKPLEILIEDSFEKYGSNVTPELLKEVKRIIYSNLTLIPDTLFSEYKKLADSSTDDGNDIFALRDIVSTYYNLRRKELGYPFKRNAITPFCIDVDERMSIIAKNLRSSIFMAFVIFAAATALSALTVFVPEEWMGVIYIAFITFGILVYVIWKDRGLSFRQIGSLYKKELKISNNHTKHTKAKNSLCKSIRNFVKRKPRKNNIGQNKL